MGDLLFQNYINDQSLDPAKISVIQARQLIVENLLNNTDRGPRSRGPNSPVDLNEFYELVQQVITTQQQREGATDLVDFAEDYPPTAYERETITFRLNRREPGTLSSDQPFTTGVRNHRPIFRESVPDLDNPGYNILSFSRFFDNIVEFTCWANTNKQVNDRAMWLEETLFSWGWYFQYKGLDRLIYYGQGQDLRQENDNVRLIYRTLTYYVRTQRIYTLQEKALEDILLSISLA